MASAVVCVCVGVGGCTVLNIIKIIKNTLAVGERRCNIICSTGFTFLVSFSQMNSNASGGGQPHYANPNH